MRRKHRLPDALFLREAAVRKHEPEADVYKRQVRAYEEAAAKDPRLEHVMSLYSASTPKLYLNVNRTQAMTEGIALPQLFTAIQTAFGGQYINTFSKMCIRDRASTHRPAYHHRHHGTPHPRPQLHHRLHHSLYRGGNPAAPITQKEAPSSGGFR